MLNGAFNWLGRIAMPVFTMSIMLMLPALSTSANAGQTDSYTLPQQAYNQSRARDYKVYTPAGLSSPAPMVMALHGCKQTSNDVLNDWGLKAAADQHGFILVTPDITSYDGLRNQNCWGFWFDHHRHQGAGEVEDLHQIALAVESDYAVDPDRRYITGLSSGGAMAVVAAVAHNEYWAAAAPASGIAYGEDAASVSLSGQCPGSATFHNVSRVVSDMEAEVDSDYAIPLMVLQNENDCTVIKKSADNIRDAHLKVFGDPAFDTPVEAKAEAVACSPFFQNNYSCMRTRYTSNGTSGARSVVETVFYDGPLSTPNTQDTNHGHYWVAGDQGSNGKWAVRKGPSYPDIIWSFFNQHSRGDTLPDAPVITLIGDNPVSVDLNAPYTDAGATAEDPEDGSVTVTSDCTSVDTSEEGAYSCIYTATDSDGNVTTAERQVNVVDPNAPTETCEQATASPSAHVNAGRAYAGGNYNLRALASGDNVDIGGSFDSWSSVTLYKGDPGAWFASEPSQCASGGGSGGGGNTFVCQDWNASNLNHNIANRAYYAGGYYTTGGDEYLGAIPGSNAWVKETSEGIFQLGQCQ